MEIGGAIHRFRRPSGLDQVAWRDAPRHDQDSVRREVAASLLAPEASDSKPPEFGLAELACIEAALDRADPLLRGAVLVTCPDCGRSAEHEVDLVGFALARLRESGRSESLQARHAEYFVGLAEEAEPYLWGPDQADWGMRLEADHAIRQFLAPFVEEDDARRAEQREAAQQRPVVGVVGRHVGAQQDHILKRACTCGSLKVMRSISLHDAHHSAQKSSIT